MINVTAEKSDSDKADSLQLVFDAFYFDLGVCFF